MAGTRVDQLADEMAERKVVMMAYMMAEKSVVYVVVL